MIFQYFRILGIIIISLWPRVGSCRAVSNLAVCRPDRVVFPIRFCFVPRGSCPPVSLKKSCRVGRVVSCRPCRPCLAEPSQAEPSLAEPCQRRVSTVSTKVRVNRVACQPCRVSRVGVSAGSELDPVRPCRVRNRVVFSVVPRPCRVRKRPPCRYP